MGYFNFTNKVAIVTGGGGGIGRAASLKIAAGGAKVVIVDLQEESGMNVVNEINEDGGEAIFIKTDVTKEEDVKNYVHVTIDRYSKIDILLNNAGWLGEVVPIVDYPVDVFDRVMDINVRGVFLGMKYVLPHMMTQKSGAIVNTASAAGLLGTPNLVAYGASKHAVLGMTKSAGVEAAPHGVRVNAICPGGVDTSMLDSVVFGYSKGNAEEAELKRMAIKASSPDGRYADPEEIANLMLYLVSDLSSHIVGQHIVIDGGAILT
ncbi:NAD(P)-dependent dehydrogenase (short-subunit alcohol dehydrogenase family) [Neobacillus niacini]|uniref:SDR family NAD(P)-dependent oxidoreductase n=1 Tax=Neobacillus niacini TaxID=86668 RepID=UPI0028556EDC|nr:glucose 1-dehydrogenase [Neobacillus niacini]MDR7075742.1 NAD(P)-dependent dehydrogenase (short-subunit alcohol dehydrogenase family) [Neobacillus niacini]